MLIISVVGALLVLLFLVNIVIGCYDLVGHLSAWCVFGVVSRLTVLLLRSIWMRKLGALIVAERPLIPLALPILLITLALLRLVLDLELRATALVASVALDL